MTDVPAIRERFLALSSHLDERGRRIFAATEARTAGHGGIAAVSRATGIAASTIGRAWLNTVHFAIRMVLATSIHVVGCGVRGRSG